MVRLLHFQLEAEVKTQELTRCPPILPSEFHGTSGRGLAPLLSNMPSESLWRGERGEEMTPLRNMIGLRLAERGCTESYALSFALLQAS